MGWEGDHWLRVRMASEAKCATDSIQPEEATISKSKGGMNMGHSPKARRVDSTLRMTFPEVLKEIIRRQVRITKLEWDNPEIYCQLRNSKLMIKLEDGWHDWIISDGDLFGDDWVVLEGE